MDMSMETKKALSSIAIIGIIALLSACHKTPPVSGTYESDGIDLQFNTTTKAELEIGGMFPYANDFNYVQDGSSLRFTNHEQPLDKGDSCKPIIVNAKILNDGAQIKLTSLNCSGKDVPLAVGYRDPSKRLNLSKVLPDAD